MHLGNVSSPSPFHGGYVFNYVCHSGSSPNNDSNEDDNDGGGNSHGGDGDGD